MEQKSESPKCRKSGRIKALAGWTIAWTLSMALVAFGHKFLWDYNPVISTILIAVNLLIGIGMIRANILYLNNLDELQRKLSLEAMALSLGVAVIVGLSYSMLDIVNVVTFDAEISHLVMLIGITYLVGLGIGNLRYR